MQSMTSRVHIAPEAVDAQARTANTTGQFPPELGPTMHAVAAMVTRLDAVLAPVEDRRRDAECWRKWRRPGPGIPSRNGTHGTASTDSDPVVPTSQSADGVPTRRPPKPCERRFGGDLRLPVLNPIQGPRGQHHVAVRRHSP
jgi:hypothetical protein